MATETKFTPGPWGYESGEDAIFSKKNDDTYGTFIAQQPPATYEIGHAEWRHNARLIAAAPELYAALEAIIAWEQSEDGPFAWEVLGQAKAALAKARGEA